MNDQQVDNSGFARVLEKLGNIVGEDNVLVDDESLLFYSTDVYRQADILAKAVVRPGSVQELQELVRCCAGARIPVVVRGGGASYTDGYLPVKPNTVSIDTARLIKIDVDETNLGAAL
jgi:glycolate oxidase